MQKIYLDQENSFTKYMSKTSFGVYVLHYFVLVIVWYILTHYFNVSAFWNYSITFVLMLTLSFGLFEIISKIPVLRYLVLWIYKKYE